MAKFKVGDRVSVVNGYGFVIPGTKTVTEIEHPACEDNPRYFYVPTDTPWFSHPEKDLTLVA